MSTWCEKCALEYPALTLLASEFLHADWPDEYEDVDDAVNAFAAERPALAARFGGEVEELLGHMLSDEQLADLLVGHLGLAYWPEGPYVSYGRWLRSVAEDVAQMVGQAT